MNDKQGERRGDHRPVDYSDTGERLWWRAYFLATAAAIVVMLCFPRLNPFLASSPALLTPAMRLAILMVRDPWPLRRLMASPWGSAYTLALLGILPLAVAFHLLGLPLEAACAPAVMIAATRLAILVAQAPSQLRALVATPWARAFTIAFGAIPPLAVVLWAMGLPPELAPVPALLIAMVRVVTLALALRGVGHQRGAS